MGGPSQGGTHQEDNGHDSERREEEEDREQEPHGVSSGQVPLAWSDASTQQSG